MSAGVPLVTVLTPVFDGEEHLAEALESLRSQTFTDWEGVVIDDGSRDSSAAIARQFAGADARFRVHSQENRGQPHALNTGLELARGRYVAILDADDVALPDRLERQVARLEADPRLGLVGGAVIMIGADGREIGLGEYPLGDPEIRQRLEGQTAFVHSAATFRRELAIDSGGYRPATRLAEDLDLWLRLAERAQLANLPEPVVRYRMHPGQLSITRIEEQVMSVQAGLAAARERRAGRADPLEGVERLDRELLASLGVDDAAIARMAAETASWWGRVLERAGDDTAAERAWNEARAFARGPGGGRALEADILRERGRAAGARGRRFSAALLAARARLLSLGGAPR
ncbi:MAG: glycosyltransferase family 2 protein [Thermoleophilaceae bacterium]